MAKKARLKKENETIYPLTIPEAVKDPQTNRHIGEIYATQNALADKENLKAFKEVELDNYTLTNSDVNNFLVFNSNNPITLYVPESLDKSIVFEGVQNGAGKITFSGVGLIEIESPDESLETGGKNDVFNLTKKSENKYVLQKRNFKNTTVQLDGNNTFTGDNEFTQPVVIPAATNDNEAVAYGQVFPERTWYEQISMDITLQSNTYSHAGEAQIAKIDDDLFRAYRFDPNNGHTGNSGNIYMQKSTDLGETWESQVSVFEDVDYDCRNIVFGAIGGKLILFFRRFENVNKALIDIGYITSDDGGNTWSSYTTLDSEFDGVITAAFGKIFTDGTKHYASFYTSTDGARCEWLESIDGGDTWQFSQVVYENTAETFVEPYFEYVGNNTFVGLIRTTSNTDYPFYQIASTDGGVNWSNPVITNHNDSQNLPTAPFLNYDESEDVLYSIAVQRNSNSQENKILLYANRPSEVVSNSESYRLISEQLCQWQKNTPYGYTSMVKIGVNKHLVNYTERYLYPVDHPDYNQRENASTFQFEINSNLGKEIISPTVKENYRVKSNVGIWESRDFDPYKFNKDILYDLNERDIDNWNEVASNGSFRDYGLDQLPVVNPFDIQDIESSTRFFLGVGLTGAVSGLPLTSGYIQTLGYSGSTATRVIAYDRFSSDIYTARRPDQPFYKLYSTADFNISNYSHKEEDNTFTGDNEFTEPVTAADATADNELATLGQTKTQKLEEYTVATLPASPSKGDQALVTDADTPSWNTTVTGGGSSEVVVWYNGTNWIIH